MIWTAAMMVDHLGHGDAARAIEGAIETVLGEGAPLTPDLGGSASTSDVGEAVAAAL